MTKKYKDSFCKPAELPDGRVIADGAARNYRISQYEHGLDDIIRNVSEDSAKRALESVEALLEARVVLTRLSRKKVRPMKVRDEEDRVF